jgi:hypothetical protein
MPARTMRKRKRDLVNTDRIALVGAEGRLALAVFQLRPPLGSSILNFGWRPWTPRGKREAEEARTVAAYPVISLRSL